jgi:hypothetical protein
MERWTKAIIILVTLALTGVGIWGNILMEQVSFIDKNWNVKNDLVIKIISDSISNVKMIRGRKLKCQNDFE